MTKLFIVTGTRDSENFQSHVYAQNKKEAKEEARYTELARYHNVIVTKCVEWKLI